MVLTKRSKPERRPPESLMAVLSWFVHATGGGWESEALRRTTRQAHFDRFQVQVWAGALTTCARMGLAVLVFAAVPMLRRA